MTGSNFRHLCSLKVLEGTEDNLRVIIRRLSVAPKHIVPFCLILTQHDYRDKNEIIEYNASISIIKLPILCFVFHVIFVDLVNVIPISQCTRHPRASGLFGKNTNFIEQGISS